MVPSFSLLVCDVHILVKLAFITLCFAGWKGRSLRLIGIWSKMLFSLIYSLSIYFELFLETMLQRLDAASDRLIHGG